MLKIKQITVQGEVQQVGYRRRVWSMARRLTIKGYVKNMPDGSVKIVAQGDESSLDQFLLSLKIAEPPITVDSVDVKQINVKKGFKDFKILLGSTEEELQEGLGAGEAQLYLFRSEFKDYRSEFRGFAQRTDENFRSLEAKYGEISEKLTMILDTLQKESLETRTQLIRAVDALTDLIKGKMQ